MQLEWDTPIQYARKVGPVRAGALAKEGVRTVGDLLLYPPFRYEDRTRFRSISRLQEGETACVFGRIIAAAGRVTPRARMKVFEIVVRDEAGALNVIFFNQPYLRKIFKEGQRLVLYGKAERDPYSYTHRFQFKNPEYEIIDDDTEMGIHIGQIIPIYRKLGPLTGKQLRVIVHYILKGMPGIPETLPADILQRRQLPDRDTAIRFIHFPPAEMVKDGQSGPVLDALAQGDSPAHQRMIFEEFFILQAGLRYIARQRQTVAKGHRIEITDPIRQLVRQVLPFKPTAAQKRVIRQIVEDMKAPAPMHRLLQGDVGSGKTIVAIQAVIVAVENQGQAVVMAPTEILAEQHYRNFSHILSPTGYRIALLTSAMTVAERRLLRQRIAAGDIQVVVGTHAVIQEEVDFQRLVLAVIDEQHRFGVMQRAALMKKGQQPDILVMTATPIPRTLALTVYGDLSLSVIDEMPPGRQAPQTILLRGETELRRAWELIRREVEQGRQAYVVYPLIEESEKVDLRDALAGYEDLSRRIFPDLRVGLLHGRLGDDEKSEVMQAFVRGELHVLVSTTVIEVGIDVPAATVMVIQHAERFGLSQLHQLRGRIGRGGTAAWCVLVAYDARTEEARRRLDVMCRTTDGFLIAEEDLAIRGPGEFSGTRQSGMLNFRFGSLVRHRQLMEEARAEADDLVARALADPRGPEMNYIRWMRPYWDERFGLVRVG